MNPGSPRPCDDAQGRPERVEGRAQSRGNWKAEITGRLPDASAVREDVLEEMAQHIEDRYAALVRGGLPEDQAYTSALEELADSAVLVAMLRPTRPPSAAELPVGLDGRAGSFIRRLGRDLLQDLRYGARTLRRNPRFTSVSILALALGIGVNTVVFTAYKALIARPIDARDPGTLVNIALRLQSGETMTQFSYPDFEAYRDGLRSFSGLIAFSSIERLTLSGADGVITHRRSERGTLLTRWLLPPQATNTEIATTFVVSENYFAVLGVPPVRGRTFGAMSPSELAASPVVLISENYWHDRFAGDPDIVGKIVRLNGAAFTIAGVTPANFIGTSIAVPNFWLPLSLYPSVSPDDRRLRDRENLCCRMFGRLAPGVTMGEAQAEATVLSSGLHVLHEPTSERSKATSVVISPGSPLPYINANLRLTIALITAAAMMVLLIACANAAGLQLARATARQQELGVRLSLGASRSRLIRQLLTESAQVGVLAGATALPVSWALMRLAVVRATEQLPAEYTFIFDVTPDVRIFASVLVLSVLAGLGFGLAPAFASSRSALIAATRSGGASLGRGRLRQGLIAAQVAVSLMLMIAGGLLVRSAIQALTMDTGYDVDRVVAVTVNASRETEETSEARAALVSDLHDRFAAVAGVTAITSARAPSDNGARRAAVSLHGGVPSVDNADAAAYYTWVQPDYFDTLGIALVRGRGFAAPVEQAHVAIVSEAAARRLWPGQDPIGQTLRFSTTGQFHRPGELLPDGPTWQVVGVARDTRGAALDGSDSRQVYVPMPVDRVSDYPLLLRTSVDPNLVVNRLAPIVAEVDPALTVTTATLQSMLRQTQAFLAASLSAAIASSIGLCGLLLASMGIYSMVSYDVVLRAREVGIRMAIGAQKRDILNVVMRGSLRAVLVGLAVGVVLAIGAARLLRGVLYGLGALDVVSFAAASALFLTIALAASWLPSRRAMRIDPLVALRDQ
jgi:putative ABC transport system permease protein